MLTAEDAQVRLGVSRATFWNLVRRHRLQRYKIPAKGKRVFFRRSDVDRLLEPIPVGERAAT